MASYNNNDDDDAQNPNSFQNTANLNTLSSEYDIGLSHQDQVAGDPFALDDDLAIFTNTNFLDLETGESTDNTQQPQFKMSANTNISPSSAFPGSANGPEFSPNDFNFLGFPANAFSNMHDNTFPNTQPSVTPASNPARLTSKPGTTSLSNGGINSLNVKQSPSVTSSELNLSSNKANKQQSTDLHVSAEEDKRRRNTAASARFRVKKKQREQAMEKTAKEMTDKVTHLEDTISELRKENSLLKGLLTEKAGKPSSDNGSKRRQSESSDENVELRKKRGKPATAAEESS